MYRVVVLSLLPLVASATGVSRPLVRVVDAKCQPVTAVGSTLNVLHAWVHMVCAPPRPDGPSCSPETFSPRQAEGLYARVAGCETPLEGRWVAQEQTCEGVPVLRFDGKLPKGQQLELGGGAQAKVRTRGRGRYRCPEPEPHGAPTERVNTRPIKLWAPPDKISLVRGQLRIANRVTAPFVGDAVVAADLKGARLDDIVAQVARHPKTGDLELSGEEVRTHTFRNYRAGPLERCRHTEKIALQLQIAPGITARGEVSREHRYDAFCAH